MTPEGFICEDVGGHNEIDDLMEEGFTIVESTAFLACKWAKCELDDPCGPNDGHLTVVFHRGKKTPEVPGARWEYLGVARGTFDSMLVAGVATDGADSTGRFFAREIKGRKQAYKLGAK
jgi:hypothetical protein